MKLRRLPTYITLSVCVSILAFSLTGCQKNKPGTESSVYRPTSTKETTTEYTPVIIPTTTPAPNIDLPTLTASNITAPAGSAIDYLGNLTITDTDGTEITQIYVNTSEVRYLVPGTYQATYTINFKGYPVLKTIDVIITEPASATSPTAKAELSGTPMKDMEITLLSGLVCRIPCTTEHYIVESYTDETYSTIGKKRYLTSVLKVVFSDGEVIDLETAYSRVASK